MKTCKKCLQEKELTEFYKMKGYRDGYHGWCKECFSSWRKEYKIENKEKIAEQDRIYRLNNPQKAIDRSKKYRLLRPDRVRESSLKAYYRNVTNPSKKLGYRIHSSISNAIKGKKHGNKWQDLVGYSLDDLKNHLESQFLIGMSWSNYGKWHIDHIIPKSKFNYSDPSHIDFKRCWALTNLRPLWAKDNISKSNKLNRPLQPSLAFGY